MPVFDITDDDTKLGAEIAGKLGAKHGVAVAPEHWACHVALLRSVGYQVETVESGTPAWHGAYGRVEPKVKELLARLAPPGANITANLRQQIRAEVIELVTAEFVAGGMPEGTARAMGAFVGATMKITPKEPKNA